MHELTAIVRAYKEAVSNCSQVVLATVVRTRGSAYRRAGARMLVRVGRGGVCTATGAISGGCLERDVCERAQRVVATGEAMLVTYDSTASDDIVWGLGLGCDGIVEVLLESLAGEAGAELMRFLAAHLELRARGVIATIIRTDFEETPPTSAHTGARMMIDAQGRLTGRVISQALAEDMRGVMTGVTTTNVNTARGVTQVKSYDTPQGRIEVFIESIEPPASLVLFGAGADAVPVARLAHDTGLHVTVVDHRPAYLTPERFPVANEIIVSRPETVTRKVAIDARTFAVVMTHSYEHDRELLKMLITSQARYIGMLGPKRRTERMLVELLSDESFKFDDDDLIRLHAPVGLDIGAETPEEIAVSIIAEVRACITGRAAAN
jgi:xanthine/CO dehydrogenase XdhC/CoxF family maturation factor